MPHFAIPRQATVLCRDVANASCHKGFRVYGLGCRHTRTRMRYVGSMYLTSASCKHVSRLQQPCTCEAARKAREACWSCVSIKHTILQKALFHVCKTLESRDHAAHGLGTLCHGARLDAS